MEQERFIQHKIPFVKANSYRLAFRAQNSLFRPSYTPEIMILILSGLNPLHPRPCPLAHLVADSSLAV
jgi:hypothetical protein